MAECDNVQYKVIFFGSAAKDVKLVNGLAKKLQIGLGLSPQSIAKIMYTAPIVFKKEVDLSRAQWLKAFLEEMVSLVKIEPMGAGGIQPNTKMSEETIPTRKWTGSMPVWESRESISIRESHTLS